MNSWTMKVGGVVLMALMASTVWGRLGESPEQCDKRYGLDYTQKGPDNFWSFSRDYKKSGIRVSIRFLKFSSGVIVAGWIAYETDYTVKEPGELRNRIREAISDSWSSLDEGKPTPNMPPAAIEQLKVKNKNNAALREMISSVSGNSYGRFWASPTAYAKDSGFTLVMFSNEYYARYEKWRDRTDKIKDNTNPLPTGF